MAVDQKYNEDSTRLLQS